MNTDPFGVPSAMGGGAVTVIASRVKRAADINREEKAMLWHHGLRLGDGTPYPLRNRLDEGPECGEISNLALGLTLDQCRTASAVHELGHAVVWLAAGLRVIEVSVEDGPGGQAECGPIGDRPDGQLDRIIGVVAGERASDRWLRESGLWTPSRAAMAELGAAHDRALVFASKPQPMPRFDGGAADYSQLHGMADRALDRIWDRVTAALPALVSQGRLTGEELAAITGLANQT